MITAVAPSSVLLVSPKTYNYHSIIIKALKESGHQCAWFDERPYSHPLFKLFSRLSNRLARRYSASLYIKRLRCLCSTGFSPSHILVIKGEAIHSSVILHMRSMFPQAKFILYFWDSAANLPGYRSLLSCFDVVASFDRRDCDDNGWIYHPLFSGNRAYARLEKPPVLSIRPPCYDWSFVGVVHSDRLEFLDRLISGSTKAASSFIYIYFPSYLHVLFYFFRSPAPFYRLLPYIRLKPLAPSALQNVYSLSRCILDVHHPRQTGLTMRTIESIISGIKIATTNSYIVHEPLYAQERVLLLERTTPAIPDSFMSMSVSPISAESASCYQPARWVDHLLRLERAHQK